MRTRQHIGHRRLRLSLRRCSAVLEALERRLALSGNPFAEPPVIFSDPVTHTLTTTLTQSQGTATIGDDTVSDAWTYNGSYVGPTLWVQPGDTLDVTIINNINQVSNLHTHGLHVSPEGNSDNVLLNLEPGETNRFTIRIPEDHPNGLNWYHAHLHGVVNDQLAKGLSGLIVIGRPDGGAAELNGLPQHLLALKNARVQNGLVLIPGEGSNVNAQTYSVNGQLQPVLDVPVGRYDVFNVAAIGTNAFYSLQVFDPDSGLVMPISTLAIDGNPFSNVEQVESVLVPPARRLSFVVPPKVDDQGNAIAGSLILQSAGYSDGTNDWPAVDLMTINYAGAPIPLPAPPVENGDALTPVATYYRDLRKVPDDQIAARRTVVFGEGEGVLKTINNESFPLNPIFQPRTGTVEEWTLVNPTGDDHPFHLHVNPQQVTATETTKDGLPIFQDVINVPAFESLTIRIEFLDYLGQFVYHCHRTKHEDQGMMALVNIVPNRPSYALSANSGGGSIVKVTDPVTGNSVAEFAAFDVESPTGINVDTGDVNGDGVYDIIAGMTDYSSQVRVIDGTKLDQVDPVTGVILPSALLGQFSAYGKRVRGVYVAVADINGDGVGDVVTGAGTGGSQVVKIIDGTKLSMVGADGQIMPEALIASFNSLGGKTSSVRVAAGDINGDGRFDIITGAGPGAEPRVRVFDGQSRNVIADFLAYDSNMLDGVYVAAGNVKGWSYTDIVTGPGAGPTSTPLVKVFSSDAGMHSTGPIEIMEMDSFLAYKGSFRGGVRVAAAFDNTTLEGYGSSRDDIIVAPAVGDGTAGTIFARNIEVPDPALRASSDCCTCCTDGTCEGHTLAMSHASESDAQPVAPAGAARQSAALFGSSADDRILSTLDEVA